MTSKPPKPFINPIVYEIQQYDPEQKRRLRQICFWVLLAYLEVTWFGNAALNIGAVVASVLLISYVTKRADLRQRPTFIVLQAATFALVVIAALRTDDTVSLRDDSFLPIVDAAALGALTVVELGSPKKSRLLVIAVEHVLGLALNPLTSIRLLDDVTKPDVGAVALLRIFAIIMLSALFIRLWFARVSPVVVAPETIADTPEPRRPMSAAEWDAQIRQ